MSNGNPLSLVGIMLALASLLGSFFYIQLSQWLRDILALSEKIDLNKQQGDSDQKKAIVECRVEMRRLSSWHNYIVNGAVILFVLYVLWLTFGMISLASADPLHGYVRSALIAFTGVFSLLSLSLFGIGAWRASNAQAILQELD
jgi:hypothetical protein